MFRRPSGGRSVLDGRAREEYLQAQRLRMQEYIGLLIAAVRRRIKQAVLGPAAGHGLTPQQFWFLVANAEQPGISQAELAHRVRADAPTASRLVAAMAERGLLRTELDPDDRRRARVFLTAAG